MDKVLDFLKNLPRSNYKVIGGLAIGGVGGVGFSVAVRLLLKKLDDAKKNSKQEYLKRKRETELQYLRMLQSLDFEIADKMGKKHICFVGPTAVGKSTLCNVLFNCNQEVGLGQTTQQAVIVKETQKEVYWDVRGMNNQWEQYRQEELGFFKNLDKVFLLQNGSISDIKFLAEALNVFNLELIFVRTKCDQWKEGMKPIDAVLQQDEDKLKNYNIKYTKVIAVGKNKLESIKQLI